MAKVVGTCIRHGEILGYIKGNYWSCVICHSAACRKWEALNPERVKAQRARRAAKIRKGPRPKPQFCAQHGEATVWHVYSGKRKCVACFRARARIKSKEWRSRNLEKAKAMSLKSAKAWAKANPERRNEQTRKWLREHPGAQSIFKSNRRAKESAAYSDGSVEKFWPMILKAYQGLCAYCEKPAKGMDHVIPLARGGQHVASNVRPACHSCNSRKHTSIWEPRPWAAALPSSAGRDAGR